MQSDTLLLIVKDEPNDITGKLGALKLNFFRPARAEHAGGSEDKKDWVAYVGMHVTKKPGIYKLTITVKGKTPFMKDISVSKRDFPVTNLVVTPELSQKGYTGQKIVNTILTNENKTLQTAFNGFTKTVFSPKPFIYPLDEIKVTGDFGDIRKSGTSAIQHLGVDLKAPFGTPVHAANDGKIVLKTYSYSYGNTLVIDHGLGLYSVYLHLSSFSVEKNQIVKQGDTIALTGDTGYAIGPHLHFSIKMRGATLDPLKFIEATQNDGNN